MADYVYREMEPLIQQMAGWFPVVSLTGPRQSGKSTLLKHAFPDYTYVNLEDPQNRAAALNDPVSFIRQRPEHLIIDEAQYAPDLFSMIQVVSDERGTTGQYILSGSQNFLMMQNINQSLAGRVGILKLLPLSYNELEAAQQPGFDPDTFTLRGGYPRMFGEGIPARLFFSSYIETYIERDVVGFLDVRNKATFRKFLTLCAHNAGNLVNLTKLSDDLNISLPTVKSWLSILESSYIAFALKPFSFNTRKTLTKTPKLYFYDTGLLCHLLQIESVDELIEHKNFGAIFENMIISETAKMHLNQGIEPSLYFYRDDSKREIDLIDYTKQAKAKAAEIKTLRTYHAKYARHLNAVCEEIGIPQEFRSVVSRVESTYQAAECKVITARDWLLGKD